MAIVNVNSDGTVSPITHASIFDYANGESERSALLDQLTGWSGFFCKYADIVADSAISRVVTPYAKSVLYLSSVVALAELVRHIGIAWEQTKDIYQDYTVEKSYEFRFELFKLSKRVHDFAYRIMRLEWWKVASDLIVMRVTRDVLDAVESIWGVARARDSLKNVEDEQLLELKQREVNVMFVQSLADVSFHIMGLGALLSTVAVTGHMLLAVGSVSVVTSLATRYVKNQREEYESCQAAEKVNALIDAGAVLGSKAA